MDFGGYGGDEHIPLYIFCLLFKKTQKKYKRYQQDLYLNQILHYFDLKKFFPRMNNKNFRKKGPQGTTLLFLYKVSIVVLIDFIAILVTSGIFLIQIVNTNNTRMYLIHFHFKNNFKMRFPKSWIFSFKPTTSIHYSSQRS